MANVDIGTLIKQLREARENIATQQSKFDAKILPVKEGEASLERELIEALKSVKSNMGRTAEYSASIQTAILPRIVDSKKFERYCKRHDALHLFERRIARVNFAEWLKSHRSE